MTHYKILPTACAFGALAALAISGTALAKPDKPITAATTESGTGCLVRDADGAYHFDADCKWSLTMKTDENGNITLYNYRDAGTLPEDAPHPDKALKTDFAAGCSGTELVTPAGKYSSDCKFNASNQ